MLNISEGTQPGEAFHSTRLSRRTRRDGACLYGTLIHHATGNSQVVALKIVHTENESHNAGQAHTFFEALKNEVELLRRLKHPNIVKLFPVPRSRRQRPVHGARWK